MKALHIITAATAALILSASTSFAQSSNGVHISGAVSNSTQVSNQVTQARGNATASTSVGSIHGGTRISGRVVNRTRVQAQRTLASGRGAQACTSIGSIGNDQNC